MADLNFSDEQIQVTPIILFIDYVNIQYNNYLKKNFKNLTPRDFTYLANIFYRHNMSQRDLADLLGVSEANVTQIIKRLEKTGYIKRKCDENNKSRKIVELTEDGKLAIFTLLKAVYEWEAKLFEGYSAEEIEKFKIMLYEFSEKSTYP
ncbi:MarR family winged helix-turn-helix transcriptional regulator [Methanobrevibacter sp.]|uniref:MarR family winged helix-turn-helix transcriptional regulator n=1 Tax=Methanobrevibacter sp. TaxID=66852 RepID=UPI0038900297